jgi:hypothetical protein
VLWFMREPGQEDLTVARLTHFQTHLNAFMISSVLSRSPILAVIICSKREGQKRACVEAWFEQYWPRGLLCLQRGKHATAGTALQTAVQTTRRGSCTAA